MRFYKKNIVWLVLGFVTFISSCGENSEQDNPSEEESSQSEITKVTSVWGIVSNEKYTIGDTIRMRILTEGNTSVDSVKIIFGGKDFLFSGDELEVTTKDILPGKQTITIEVSFLNASEKHTFPIEMLSDIVPGELTYQRVTYYTHDPDAYTQGLFYHNGYLYESTGKKGESNLRKVELTTGKVLEQSFLPDQYFGEGITLWNDQIIQLTWTSNQGFVYTLDGFERLKSFNYPTEGYGIATIGDELVMSDGSENLYFLDTEKLLETHRLQVYDDKGPITNLNELEYIEGSIYANVWQTNDIITIDPQTGKVLSRIDLTGLMNAQWSRRLDVLNGIAYDKANKRLYVTGKWWPRLYEIRLLEKKPS